jgi:hypothetical protein
LTLKLRQVAAVALTGLSLALLAAPAAEAARSEFFGAIQGPPLDDTDFDGIAATRVKTVRFLLPWMLIEQSRGQLDWSDTDEVVGGLASRGIQGVPFAFGSPSWTRAGGTFRPPVNSRSAKRGWQAFLRAAVARYGPGGSYWTHAYRQQFGDGATPVPIRSWQVWNEPNLRQEESGRLLFAPGATVEEAARLYAELLRISHEAINSEDRQAKVVTAGFVTQKDPKVFRFIDRVYSTPGIKADFDAVAQHPYAETMDKMRAAINGVRNVMAKHGDRATPLWITEIGWGSAPPYGGINMGPEGQASILTRSYKLILGHRRAWNVQRLYWFHWRDPEPGSPYWGVCIRCGSAGLLTYDRIHKPAYDAFVAFTAETVPPVATITAGPGAGAPTNDATPTFQFSSNEAGSTFRCRFDSKPLAPCFTPFAPKGALINGSHTFSVRATDAAGNESTVAKRSFRVDTRPPSTPQVAATVPKSPANDNSPRVRGSAEPGSTVKIYATSGCTGAALARGPASRFAGPGIAVRVNENATAQLRATATDAAGNRSSCSTARKYVEDSAPPQTTITSGPSGSTGELLPTFTFTSSQPGSSFECRFDSDPFAPCSGPGASHSPSTPLSYGPHTFGVRATDPAKNLDPTPAARGFTVAP